MAPKRKRTAAEANPQTESSEQDESKETPADEETQPSKRAADDPPTKRTRATRSTSTSKPSLRTGSSSITTTQQPHSSAAMPANTFSEGGGEHGEAGKMRMEAPPPAGTIDPEGYKTNPPPKGRPVRVYADGVFDLFHLGHMRQLQQAKTAFPDTYLIVGVTGDHETHKRKGLTVMSAQQRAESLRHCRWVDEVIEDCPWIINVEFLEQHEIDYVAHDDIPYGASEGDDIYKPIKEKGKFLVTQRTEGVSTTGIITKIVRDYEQYIARQLKRGTSRQELNISWLKKNELDIRRHVAELRDTIRNNWATTGQELSRDFRQFWQPSRPSSPAPPSLRNGIAGGSAGRASGSGAAPRSPTLPRSSTPQRERKNMDFAAGYAMGLIGGVKGWMEGSRRRNLSDSRPQSPGHEHDDDSGASSPAEEGASGAATRGRRLDPVSAQLAAEEEELDV